MIRNRIFFVSFSYSLSWFNLLLFSMFNILWTCNLSFIFAFRYSLLCLFFSLKLFNCTRWRALTLNVSGWHHHHQLWLRLLFSWKPGSDHYLILLLSCCWLLVSCLITSSEWVILRSWRMMLFLRHLRSDESLRIVYLLGLFLLCTFFKW